MAKANFSLQKPEDLHREYAQYLAKGPPSASSTSLYAALVSAQSLFAASTADRSRRMSEAFLQVNLFGRILDAVFLCFPDYEPLRCASYASEARLLIRSPRERAHQATMAASTKKKFPDFHVDLESKTIQETITLFQAEAKMVDSPEDCLKLAKLLKNDADRRCKLFGTEWRRSFGFLCSGHSLKVAVFSNLGGSYYSMDFLPRLNLDSCAPVVVQFLPPYPTFSLEAVQRAFYLVWALAEKGLGIRALPPSRERFVAIPTAPTPKKAKPTRPRTEPKGGDPGLAPKRRKAVPTWEGSSLLLLASSENSSVFLVNNEPFVFKTNADFAVHSNEIAIYNKLAGSPFVCPPEASGQADMKNYILLPYLEHARVADAKSLLIHSVGLLEVLASNCRPMRAC